MAAEENLGASVSRSGTSPKLLKKAGAQKFREHQIFSTNEATNLAVTRCRGVLRGEGVVVPARPDIVALVRLGSYGKGVFSRSVPCHNVSPTFSLPLKRERSKAGSLTSASDVPAGLSREENELVQKMVNFEASQKRRIALHAEWKREKTQLAGDAKGPPSPMQSVEDVSSPQVGLSGESYSPASLREEDKTECTSFQEHLKHFKERLEVLEKLDPYKMDEFLQLSSEEALYLSHDLKLLDITAEGTTHILNTQELWSHFCRSQHFPPKYAAYCYYRRKGWVPKSGLKFGVDFVLYKKGPVEYHSSYAVVVRLLSKSEPLGQQGGSGKSGGRSLTWRDVVAMDRVSKSVVKDLIICHVIVEEGMDSPSLWSQFPDCLESVKIAEVLVSRWDPDKER